MIKRLLIAIVALVIVAGGIIGYNLFVGKMIAGIFANMKAPPVAVSVTKVVAADWQPGLEAIGTAAAVQGTDLATEAAGIVREIRFAANDRIEKGQALVQIDDRQERADLDAARAAETLAETALTRAKELRLKGVSASSALDEAEAAAIEARATVAKLEATLSTKQLTAPFAGTIGIPQIEIGSYVTPGTGFATLQDRSRMRVDFTLTESEAALVTPGMSVTVTSEVGDVSAEGKITGIEPKIDPNSRLVTLRADVPNEGDKLTPGQFLRVRVALPVEKDVIALPQTVVSSSLYGDSVFVVREEKAEGEKAGGSDTTSLQARQVFIKVGRHFDDKVEIRTGLQSGDLVVNAGQNKLSSGATVTIDNSQSLPGMGGN
ncbi:efflux RND transporter periplasmic adaptor subunit [Rhodobacter capsulatus]|uniref:efflux RND transporter periplasmic adaptor subunit n=1 Tax=Rhodobacter capsulatus TaxID=1061 RepID=UPI0006DCF010|nr:efflux RND transporter periplasmic adaptor subunit [Rhodobacter capsulatus]KQB13359.1 RND transporter MFP subunit [Rhodobacter capsulatus]KQB13617.1 RND transporter MFP subunit [Rhodobacter capsulatus]PZX24356.1 membrane fusion protein (multidrug efflux system) [Rhodobacter capsulatus]QNR63671.1 efflux RND transporter periplasmic adaptor subunit [Rhodobacter capsulatus]